MSEDDLLGFMKLAKNVSNHSDHRIKMGAVIIKHGKPLSVGFNQLKSHPKWGYRDYSSIHAEAAAIKSCTAGNIEGSTIIIYRESRGNNPVPKMARPCTECMKLLKAAKIKKIIYSIYEFPYWEIENI